MKIGIVGATGVVGRKFVELLQKSSLAINELVLYASARSKGKTINFQGENLIVRNLDEGIDEDLDLVFISASSSLSREWAPRFVSNGTLVVDNSSGWRMEKNIPLVVPEVNGASIDSQARLIANPNCVVSQLSIALKPIVDNFRLTDIIMTSLQSVSGAGIKGIEDLTAGSANYHNWQEHDEREGFFSHPIAFNLIPQIGGFNEFGTSAEEEKVIEETRKIFARPDLNIATTCVRVPVYYGHSISLTVKIEEDCSLKKFVEAFIGAQGAAEIGSSNEYITPRDLLGDDLIHIGRIRKIQGLKGCFSLWVVGDNLLKGAALNAVQIAEYLHEVRGVV